MTPKENQEDICPMFYCPIVDMLCVLCAFQGHVVPCMCCTILTQLEEGFSCISIEVLACSALLTVIDLHRPFATVKCIPRCMLLLEQVHLLIFLFCLQSFQCTCSKLTGMAFRVPVPDVSVVDLTVRLDKPVSTASVLCCLFYTFELESCMMCIPHTSSSSEVHCQCLVSAHISADGAKRVPVFCLLSQYLLRSCCYVHLHDQQIKLTAACLVHVVWLCHTSYISMFSPSYCFVFAVFLC